MSVLDGVSVVFCDWHRVLSHSDFLSQLPREHWMSEGLARLFDDERDICLAWMRGDVTEVEVLGTVFDGVSLQLVSSSIAASIAHMELDAAVLGIVDALRARGVVVVLATDNMPAFGIGVRRTNVLEHFDDMLLSSEVRAVKSTDAERFFAPALRRWDATFAECLLIDDRQDNCLAFERAGGRAHQFTCAANLRAFLEDEHVPV